MVMEILFLTMVTFAIATPNWFLLGFLTNV